MHTNYQFPYFSQILHFKFSAGNIFFPKFSIIAYMVIQFQPCNHDFKLKRRSIIHFLIILSLTMLRLYHIQFGSSFSHRNLQSPDAVNRFQKTLISSIYTFLVFDFSCNRTITFDNYESTSPKSVSRLSTPKQG